MNREQMIESVKSQMPEKRWKHVEGVMETSIILAGRFGEDPVKAELAAILHDVAKYWPIAKMEQIIREQQLDQGLLNHDKALWHAEVGYWVAEHEYGVKDREVLDAIRYHTSGRVGMTKLDKVVCLADYMEPGRDFPGIDRIRELSETSLEQALIAGFDSTIFFLLEKGNRIYPLTVESRNDLIEQQKQGG
ncbi:bis(5'-nucleosyl)-tetraphosphatase (symmetrical) YqeK [Paenibacillus sp. JDR-2]|uniref:bis(5'-nucleosyl)-tetraphosphatase (symmetrical) YqeK n=1 Tax=Paenibacillus sp. (strain JDR-2) TaxID=324057 RepID=UPI0001663E6E|nr:bis(5'-nucleosyl)-tetraphosphatase (symmetrical) YqeK [Paenibacillus sp. JDR-2]ACT02648.1 metal dependent phosphohydrolase [Paenibacillus sp. JDR-2]